MWTKKDTFRNFSHDTLFGIHMESLLKACVQPSQDFDANEQPQAHRCLPLPQALQDFFDVYQRKAPHQNGM
jgi:hypothetical protein